MVRKLILGLIAIVGLAANTGCILNQYSSNPNERMQQLLYQSEDLRQTVLRDYQMFDVVEFLADELRHLRLLQCFLQRAGAAQGEGVFLADADVEADLRQRFRGAGQAAAAQGGDAGVLRWLAADG